MCLVNSPSYPGSVKYQYYKDNSWCFGSPRKNSFRNLVGYLLVVVTYIVGESFNKHIHNKFILFYKIT